MSNNNNNKKYEVKQFKGQVKISDVQAAFDQIVERINEMIDSYNEASYVTEIDYTKGGDTLAPSGYTLSVGGLKQAMKACDGCVVGAKPFRVDNGHFKMTTGTLVTEKGIYRLPDKVLANPADKAHSRLYFNPTTQDYQWGTKYNATEIVSEEFELNSTLKPSERFEGYYYNQKSKGNYMESSTVDTKLFKINRSKNTDELLAQGKVAIDIENYPKIFIDGNIKLEDKIEIIGYTGTIDNHLQDMMLGVYDPTAKTFEPKLKITNDSGIGNYRYYYGFLFANTPTYVVNQYSGNYIKIPFEERNGSHPSDTTGNQYVIETQKLWCEQYNDTYRWRTRFEGTNSKTGQPFGSTFTLNYNLNIEDLGINCIIFVDRVLSNNLTEPEWTITPERDLYNPSDYKFITADGREFELDYKSRTAKIVHEVSVIKDAYRICDINVDTSSNFLGFVTGVQNEKINGTYKITNTTKDFTNQFVKSMPDDSYNPYWYMALDTSSNPKFLSFILSEDKDYKNMYGYLFGTQVEFSTSRPRANSKWYPMNYLFIPKGVSNPYTIKRDGYTESDLRWSSQKVLNVNISKEIKDEG